MMRMPRVLCAFVLVLSLASFASAAPIYVYDGAVGNGTWSDVNKTGSGDTLLCWAYAASNALSWTGFWGWNPAGGGSYISSAVDIGNAFNAGWNDRTGTAMYAAEWWMTTQTQTKIPPSPGDPVYTFDSAGKGFYPTQGDYANTSPPREWGYTQSSIASMYDQLNTYITADRGIVASFDVTTSDVGPYGHDVTIWGWDPIAQEIYLTDNDDGWYGLQTYLFSGIAGGQVTILGYTNTYTDPINVQINRLVRFNLNDPFVEPVHPGGGDGVVPEPTTMILLGTGLSGLIVARRKARKR